MGAASKFQAVEGSEIVLSSGRMIQSETCCDYAEKNLYSLIFSRKNAGVFLKRCAQNIFRSYVLLHLILKSKLIMLMLSLRRN